MRYVLYVVVGILIYIFFRKLFNWGGCLGGIIGLFIGGSIGVSGSGGADNGWLLFGAIGFVIGGLIYRPSKNQ